MSRLLVRLAIGTVTSVIAGVGTGYVYSAQLSESKPVTITQRVISYSASTGKYIRTKTRIHAIRRDGTTSIVTAFETPEGVSFAHRTITDLARGVQIALEPVSKSKQTIGMRADHVESFRKQLSNCALDTSNERPEYHGYIVVKNVRTAGYLTIERWFAPELNCLPLSMTITSTRNGLAPVTVTQMETNAIAIGEPDPKLYEVTNEFVERPPSAMVRILEGVLGLPPRQDQSAEMAFDENYRHGRQLGGLP